MEKLYCVRCGHLVDKAIADPEDTSKLCHIVQVSSGDRINIDRIICGPVRVLKDE